MLVARGTSDHVAIYARYLLEARCALSASLAAPSLYTTYRPPVDLSRALVLGISQSGETPEIVAALEFAAGRGALDRGAHERRRLAARGRSGARARDRGGRGALGRGDEDVHDGARRHRGARAAHSGRRPGGGAPGAARALAAAVELPDALVESSARTLLDAEAAVCISRGYAYATALEAALKLKEVDRAVGRGLQRRRPSPRPARRRPGLPALVFHAGGPLAGDVDGLERELATAGSPIISIGPGRELPAAEGLCEELAAIALIVPAQLSRSGSPCCAAAIPTTRRASRRSRAPTELLRLQR